MADDNSNWEEKPRINDLWNLSGVHDNLLRIQAGAFKYVLQSPLSVRKQPHFIRAFRRKPPLEQNWKRQALPSVREDKSRSAGECRGRSGWWEKGSSEMKKQLLGVGLEFYIKQSHISPPSAVPTSDFPCCQRSGRPVYKHWIRDAARSLEMLFAAFCECSSGRLRPPARKCTRQQLLSLTTSHPLMASWKLNYVKYREKLAIFACVLSLSGNVPTPVKLSSNIAGSRHYCWIIDCVSRVKQRWLQNGKVNYHLLMAVTEHSRAIYKLNF